MSNFIRLAMVSLVFASLGSATASAANVNFARSVASAVCSKPGAVAAKCPKSKSLDGQIIDAVPDEGSELGMINLQQVVSQRAIATQLATQILGKLNGTCEICANIR